MLVKYILDLDSFTIHLSGQAVKEPENTKFICFLIVPAECEDLPPSTVWLENQMPLPCMNVFNSFYEQYTLETPQDSL